jgi:exodeoxyribonuclease V beta subunit
VLAPFLWDSFQMKPPVPVFHQPFAPEGGGPRGRLIDVGGRSHPDFKGHQEVAMAERDAEESRLLYVALTRARHSLVVWWIGKTWNARKSKLSGLIQRLEANLDPARSRTPVRDGILDVETLEGRAPAIYYQPRHMVSQDLNLARLDRTLDYAWRRVSFSSLSPAHPLAAADDTMEEADRTDESEDHAPAAISGDGMDGPVGMARLPRGARFGSLVHSILERVPFDAPDPAALIRAEYHRLTRHSSWDLDVEDLVSGLVAMLETPLGPQAGAPRLSDMGARAHVKEMSFELPVCAADSAVSLSGIATAVLGHLPTDDLHHSYFSRLANQERSDFRGYLTGVIDLAAVLPGPGDERYYVMDFKSNALVPWHREPTIDDYGPGPMHTAMEAGNYVLQSFLYQVALHRYLSHRLPGYHPERHLGGSMYLFVRGMIGAETPLIDGERCGIARWATPPRAVAAVSDLLVRGET